MPYNSYERKHREVDSVGARDNWFVVVGFIICEDCSADNPIVVAVPLLDSLSGIHRIDRIAVQIFSNDSFLRLSIPLHKEIDQFDIDWYK